MGIRVILADDHKIVRDGLRSLVDKHEDMEVIGEAENGREAVNLTSKMLPDVVIMDVTMPDLNGMEAARQITREIPGVKVIALSMHSDRRFVTGMLKAGAFGYLLKDCAFEEIVLAIQSVMSDKSYLSPGITGIVVDDYLSKSSGSGIAVSSVLTPREREVLQLFAEGKSAKEIAHYLNLSIKTIETHRLHIMDKLNIRNIAELTKYAVREGLTSL